MSLEVPYNPLDRIHLAESVTRALLQRPAQPLGEVERFVGSGSRRVYKQGMPHEAAVATIVEERGRRFDPDVVDAFVGIQEEFRAIAKQYADPN